VPVNIGLLYMCSAFLLFASSLLSPFFVEVSPEIRSTYVSLGKLMEDRPMMVVGSRVGFDAGDFGRFGIRNWEVSSLTDRRIDAHRHAAYHSEFGPTWQYNLELAEKWRFTSDFTRSWTVYRGFKGNSASSNRTYHWWQVEQALDNPYIVPFWRLRRCVHGNEYFYFKFGGRRRFNVWDGISVIPSVFAEGGSSKCLERVVGKKPGGGHWKGDVSSVSFRLELNWSLSKSISLFAYAEQYMVVGGDKRSANADNPYLCAHNDWTHGGFGARFKF
jgi:hypothetical protein